jgi:acyl dehydratase
MSTVSGREVSKILFEDFRPGSVAEYGPRVVSREEILSFAAEYDPQPMHLDEEAARHTLLGGLSASGWHTCCLMMRMIADGFILNSSSMGANAIEEVKWHAPVRPGDALTVRATVLDTRASKSRPDMGIVSMLFEVFTGKGQKVMTMKSPLLMGLRNPGKGADQPAC